MGRNNSAASVLGASGMTIRQALEAGVGKDCGSNVQLNFRLFDGNIVKFDREADMAAYVQKKSFDGKEYSFLSVSAFLNGQPRRFPMWAVRRQIFGTPVDESMAAWRNLLENNTFYTKIMNCDNDVERALVMAGKEYLVGEVKITYTAKEKTESKVIWTFSER